MAKEMFCEFCALQFGNDTVFKLHLKLVHNIIKEDEEMILVKPKERLTLITHNQHLLPSQILELTPESQENEHFNPVPSDLVSDNQILSNSFSQKNSKNDICASNSALTNTWVPEIDLTKNETSFSSILKSTSKDKFPKHPKAISGMETGFVKESSIIPSKSSTSKAVSPLKSLPIDRFHKHPKARSGTETGLTVESPIIASKLSMSKETSIKKSLTEETCSKNRHK